ncbi:MAG: head GIN domain-containing protein [Bacteroidia bacterium]|nr:head GIN domain-containing protein [Bacteroidia bacterium]
MKQLAVPALALALTGLLATSCVDEQLCVNGNGTVATDTLALETISGIEVRGNANLYISQGTTQEVIVKTDENLLDRVEATIENGVLVLDLKGCAYSYDLDVYVTFSEPIKSIKVSGSGDVYGDAALTAADELDLNITGSGSMTLELEGKNINSRISGSGDLILKGKAETHILRVTGSGDLSGYGLFTQNTDISVSGSGKAEILVEGGSLDVEISGSGSVYYKGSPAAINTRISGSGRLVDAE